MTPDSEPRAKSRIGSAVRIRVFACSSDTGVPLGTAVGSFGNMASVLILFICGKDKKQIIMEKIIQITSGRGPAECSWVVAQVLKVFLGEAAEHKIKATLLQREPGIENGTVETATVLLESNDMEQFISSWTGTIQWIGQSQFRKFHKRKNWFIGIFEIDKAKQDRNADNMTVRIAGDILFGIIRTEVLKTDEAEISEQLETIRSFDPQIGHM